MSKSAIPEVSSGESFYLSLGVDPSVKVTYHPQRKTVSASGGGPLGLISSSKVQVTEVHQRITIKNTRKGGAGIEKLIIRDRAPVSEDSRIRVVMLEPKALGPLTAPLTAPIVVDGPPPIPPKSRTGSGFGNLPKSSTGAASPSISRTSSTARRLLKS